MPPADLLPPGTSAVPAPPTPNVRRGTATCAAGREALWREHAEEGTPVAGEVCGAAVRDTRPVSRLNAPFCRSDMCISWGFIWMICLHLNPLSPFSWQEVLFMAADAMRKCLCPPWRHGVPQAGRGKGMLPVCTERDGLLPCPPLPLHHELLCRQSSTCSPGTC